MEKDALDPVSPRMDRAVPVGGTTLMPRKSTVLVCLCLIGWSSVGESHQRTDQIRLLFTGDIMLSRQVEAELERTQESPWREFRALFTGSDWVAGNLEGAVGSPTNCIPHRNDPCFDIRENRIKLLRDAGFRALSVENNHAGDLGAAGRDRTEQTLLEQGILPLSFEGSPRFLKLKGVTVGVIAVSLVPAADGVIQSIPSVELQQKLRLARQLANLVVVSIHWGNELLDWPSKEQRKQADWLIAHGADLILGHHPHVVQVPECLHGKPVFFSLGNHVFDQKYAATKSGLIADCRIIDAKLACSGLSTRTPPNGSTPEPVVQASGNVTGDGLLSCPVDLSPSPILSGLEIRPQPWSRDQPQFGLILGGWKNGTLEWLSRPQDALSVEIGQLAGSGSSPLIFTLERHRSSLDEEDGLRPYVYAVGPRGLIAKWRGSALAWPLIDAVIQKSSGVVCALHRTDSFVTLDPHSQGTRVAAYRWNGFGFDGIDDPAAVRGCEKLFQQ